MSGTWRPSALVQSNLLYWMMAACRCIEGLGNKATCPVHGSAGVMKRNIIENVIGELVAKEETSTQFFVKDSARADSREVKSGG